MKNICVLLVALAACAPAEPLGSTSAPQVGGQPATCANIDTIAPHASAEERAALCAAFDSVGGLYLEQGGNRYFQCTATLIGPRSVITARHCVAANLFVLDGLPAVAVTRWSQAERARGGYADRGADLAVGTLATPVDRAPLALGHLADSDVGRAFVSVGMGLDGEEEFEHKNATHFTLNGLAGPVYPATHGGYRQAELTSMWSLDEALARRLYEELGLLEGVQAVFGRDGVSVCRGDSGGPLLAVDGDGRVAVYAVAQAILARHRDCASHFTAIRVDAELPLVAQQATCPDLPAEGVCRAGGWERCGADGPELVACSCGRRADGVLGCLEAPCPRGEGGACALADDGACLGPLHLRGAADLATVAACREVRGDVFVTGTLAELAWPELVRVRGALWIAGNPALRSLALPGLVAVEGDLRLADNPALAGTLPALAEVGGALVAEAGRTPLALPALRTIGGTLEWTDRLGFTGAGALEHIGGSLEITQVSRAPAGAVFSGLVRVDGDLLITGSGMFDTLALPALREIGGSLRIAQDSVTDGFELHDDRIEGTPIRNLSGLAGLRRIGDDLYLGTLSPLPLAALEHVGGDVTLARGFKPLDPAIKQRLTAWLTAGVIDGLVDYFAFTPGKRELFDWCGALGYPACAAYAPGCVRATNRCWVPAE